MFLGATSELTVAIRTSNAEASLEELLAAIRSQEIPYEVEILAADAGSTDRTPLILRSRGIRTIHVPEGKAWLGKVADAAEGDVLVCITQDTFPLKNDWLNNLTLPLFEDEKVGMTHGRLIADASLPAYQRGLVRARPYMSGKQRQEFDGSGTLSGGRYLPPTNYGFRKRALLQGSGADAPMPEIISRLFSAGFRKVYLPDAPIVLKSAPPVRELLGDYRGGPAARPLLYTLLLEGADQARDLYELSDKSDLPSGQRGEAYASAIALHAGRAANLAGHRSPMFRKLASTVERLLVRP